VYLTTDMELRQLRIFVTVAETKSFTRAAQQLFVSHSSTSRAVSALEEEIGAVLIERGNSVIALTEAGEKLLPMAREMLRMEEEMLAIL